MNTSEHPYHCTCYKCPGGRSVPAAPECRNQSDDPDWGSGVALAAVVSIAAVLIYAALHTT